MLLTSVGISGTVAIDEMGDRTADFDFLDMTDPVTKSFSVSTYLTVNSLAGRYDSRLVVKVLRIFFSKPVFYNHVLLYIIWFR